MEETFTITVLYNNKQRDFECTFQIFGDTHKIAIPLNETIIHFEPEEERNYRAVLPFGETPTKQTDIHLLHTIAKRLEELFK